MEKKTIKVDGMHCSGCAKRVTDALLSIDGIKKVNVKLDAKEVELTTSKPVDDKIICDTVDRLGFKVF